MLTARILTLFPGMFPGFLADSLAGKALESGLWRLEALDIRDSAFDRHKTVDDTPFGGGAGMVMRPDVVDRAICALPEKGRLLCMSPRGRVFDQNLAEELAAEPVLTFLCGRYEGIDQRVLDKHGAEDVSLGDFVLSGGEPAALAMLDAIVRLIPGVMGNEETAGEESFQQGLLEYPHYTRPAAWIDGEGVLREVPEILLSGHHAKIRDWRRAQSEALTRGRRPDLWRRIREE
jgi:tRNA (guanine37-N1)-methyltransferase